MRGPSAVAAGVAWICIVGALSLFAYGLWRSGILARPTVAPPQLARLAIASGAYWIAAWAGLKWLGRERAPWLIGGLLLAVAGAAQFAATASVLFVLASAWSIGRIAFRQPSRAAGGVMPVARIAFGLALLSWFLSLAAIVPVSTPATYVVVLSLPVVCNWREMAALLRDPPVAWASSTRAETVLLALVGNAALVALLLALLPEVGNDALSHHLALLAFLREFGYWHFDVGRTLLAVMPFAGNFVYAGPYMLAGEFGAKLANFGCYLLLVALVVGWTRETAPRSAALLAGLCAATLPLALLETSSLFIENPWALFVASSVALAARSVDGDEPPASLYAAAALFGAAVASKPMAAAVAPVVLIAAYIGLRGPGRWRRLAAASLLGLVIAMPPYVIAFVKTGNPTFPFLNSVFRSPLFLPTEIHTSFVGTLSPLALYRATFFSDRFIEASPGAIGFVPLLVLPLVVATLILAGRRRDFVLIAAMLAFGIAVFAATAYLRYVYPAFVMLMMGLGTSLGLWHARDRAIHRAETAVVLVGAVATIPWLTAAAPAIRALPFEAAFSRDARAHFVDVWAPHRRLVERINLEPAAAGNVAFLGAPYTAGVLRPAYVRSMLNPSFSSEITLARTTDQVKKALFSRDITYVVVDGGTPAHLADIVREHGTLLVDGLAQLYRLDDADWFTREVLPATKPSATGKGWYVQGSPAEDGEGNLLVTKADYVATRASVFPRTRYRLEVLFRCGAGEAELRAQVTWLDASEAVLGVTANDRACRSALTKDAWTLLSPPRAATAVVHLMGVTAVPVALARVSLLSK
jgi:hypothetical protein